MNSNAAPASPNTDPHATREPVGEPYTQAIAAACKRIAPTWPLDRFIAVNPLWGMIDRPMSEVTAALSSHTGGRWLMPRAWYRQAVDEGRIQDQHLQAAIVQSGADVSLAELRSLLMRDTPETPRREHVIDVVDAQRDLVHEMSFRDFVTHSVSQVCAAYFDEGQAFLQPDRTRGLFAYWRLMACDDRAPALLMGLRGYRQHIRAVPGSASEMLALGLRELNVPAREAESYLWGLLLSQNGWASWCAYRRWTARLAGADDDAIVDLLAIRVAWEWLLHRIGGVGVQRRWLVAMARWKTIDAYAVAAQRHDWLLQRAAEIAWQQAVLQAIGAGWTADKPQRASVQAVFCIDVRSEVFRRALECSSAAVQTLGFAGFFGMPIAYQPLGADAVRPQLPGLLAPRLLVREQAAHAHSATARRERWALSRSWKSFKTGALSAFTFVEAVGPLYASALLTDSLAAAGSGRVVDEQAHATTHGKMHWLGSVDGHALTDEARCDLAAGMLRAMSLTRDFARIVLLAGHGSATRNNPHAAGLDCGACCGQTGEVNARAAAALLNAPEVRRGLRARGIEVAEDTWFVAGMHNTTTDALVLFDVDEIPTSHAADLAALRAVLAEAGTRARAERAAALGLDATNAELLHATMQQRTRDWAQVRAEWGLANNAALIVAPREHCRHLNLQGRSFLHEYRAAEDQSFATLELIMTAPMVVTHWINLQYYASTVDPTRYGSGNKVLHNVVGGHIGVFEGNGGDLRIGLPLQSVHDGERFRHQPLRLSVFIEAPRHAIEGVLNKHAHVRALVDNEWLSLFQLDADERCTYAYRHGQWLRASEPSASPLSPNTTFSAQA